jgi:pyruvate dehydrogenase E2 component (dihydrolipoamide acetyltransferase)
MAEKFLMPKLSPTMEEGQIARWVKNEGDSYEANETLAEVDTDKATMEMTALTAGTLLKIIKGAGDTAALGEAIAIIGTKGEDISALLAEVSANGSPKNAEEKAEEPVAAPKAETPAAASVSRETSAATNGGRMLVSPIAARMAAENGVELSSITGSGPGGRIIKRDIETALAEGNAPATQPQRTFTASTVVGASAYREENTSKMRQVIATRLAESIGPIPTFYLTTEIEMDACAALRKSVNASVSDAEKISLNDIVVKAAAMALVKHPFVNASYQSSSIRFYEQADIGVAVAIEDGLITPVIRGANLKGFLEISAEIKDLAAKAKAKKLQPDEYTGATFSISNLGMFGIKEFTAIINPPEAGILAVGSAAATPVIRDGEIVVRSIMNVTMSCDHRVIDGATGARFLQTFKQMLENPGMMSA